MTLSASLGLFLAMMVLALLPGPGIVVVVSQTLSRGFRAGVVCTAGIVSGDYIFIALALLGLAALAESYETAFTLVRYIGALYLVVLGLMLLREPRPNSEPDETVENPVSFSYVAGLLTTLSNPKAILFYASFFPTFMDLGRLSGTDIAIILLITTLAVGGVMLGYAWVASRSESYQASPAAQRWIRWISAIMLIGTGGYIALSA